MYLKQYGSDSKNVYLHIFETVIMNRQIRDQFPFVVVSEITVYTVSKYTDNYTQTVEYRWRFYLQYTCIGRWSKISNWSKTGLMMSVLKLAFFKCCVFSIKKNLHKKIQITNKQKIPLKFCGLTTPIYLEDTQFTNEQPSFSYNCSKQWRSANYTNISGEND